MENFTLIKSKTMQSVKFLVFIFAFFVTACNSSKELPGLVSYQLSQNFVPIFMDREDNCIVEIDLLINDSVPSIELKEVEIIFDNKQQTDWLKTATINFLEIINDTIFSSISFGESSNRKSAFKIKGSNTMVKGSYKLNISFAAKNNSLLESSAYLKEIRLTFDGNVKHTLSTDSKFAYRPALVLRSAGQDNCDTYRIPGIITTKKGTLITVYDNRYNNSKDLQEDIDIGMSRSTNGGQTWEPMKVIMDMGEWGGKPERLNGIGDPCVLYDHTTHTIWVAALWMSGSSPEKMLWWDSQPGMSPDETGQFILVKSSDDGITWSDPINITEQIKDNKWQLLLAGPGRGLTLDNGTLIIPAQFKKDIRIKAIDGGQYTCHSTIVYSTNGGISWQIGSGAKSNTTESQVVQLANGSIMLNMRDDLNRINKGEDNGRAVSVTNDMGKTWIEHPSSNSALPEPNCMASLIEHTLHIDGNPNQILFFSNPNSKTHRTHMTIKASKDGGTTWPCDNQILLNEQAGFGYSCLTVINESTIGIVYEGIKELYFQKVLVKDFNLQISK
jgi:sialidase-1